MITESIHTKTRDIHPGHHWKARLIVGLIMLVLSFLGLVITSIESISAVKTWYYWLAIGPIFAGLTIWLSWHLRRYNVKLKGLTLGHDVLQWLGLIGAILIIHTFVISGILGRFEAGLVAVVLLALSCFISGIYFDTTLLLVGIALALMAIVVSLMTEYIALILLIVLLIAAVLLFLKLHYQFRKHASAAE